MIDRDKTINALHDMADYFRLCRKNAASNGAAARKFEIYVEAAEDAAELLKAQEPRVLTLEEFEDALDTIVWVDRPQIMNSSSEFALLVSYSRKHEKTDLWFIDDDEITNWCYSDYGKTWRCWTSRPTDKQREAAPWKG